MATTLKLPFTRFVAQVSNGSVRPKSSSLAMMAENEEALKACDWHESAAKASDVAIPGNNIFEAAGYLDDRYDAFIQGGKGNLETAEFEGYAGMVAYRFKLPAAYLDGAQTLTSFSVTVSRDRYLRAGVRAVAVLSASATPSADWATVRGEATTFKTESTPPTEATDGIRSLGFMNQGATPYLINTRNAEETLIISLVDIDATKAAYLWVYLTLEDYQNRWMWRSENVKREYWIEGAAMLVGSSNLITFSADVAEDEGGVILDGGNSPDCLRPQTRENDTTAVNFLGTFIARGDISYFTTSSTNFDTFSLSNSSVFESLVNASKNKPFVGTFKIGNNNTLYGRAAGVAFTHPAREILDGNTNITIQFNDRVTDTLISPECVWKTETSDGSTIAQAGLSVWVMCHKTANGYSYQINKTTNSSSDRRDLYVTYGSMPFLQVVPLVLFSKYAGRTIRLSATSAVENTGIKTKFLLYKLAREKFVGRTAFYQAILPLINPSFVRNLDVGSVVHIDPFVDPTATDDDIEGVNVGASNYLFMVNGFDFNNKLGDYDTKLVGISEEVSSSLSDGDHIDIKCSEEIESGDWLMVLPMPTGIIDTDIDSYYFGRQADPNTTAHNGYWARYTENLGWFPRITIF